MTDQRAQYNEEAVGANHPTKADVINRLTLVGHNNDGTHKIVATFGWGSAGEQLVQPFIGSSFIVPCACTIVKIRGYARTAPTGADLIFDINKNGSTIWSSQGNRLKILAGENSGSQTTFNTAVLAEGDVVDLDCDQIGSGTAGSDVTVLVSVAV
jgi:hypothetical protein